MEFNGCNMKPSQLCYASTFMKSLHKCNIPIEHVEYEYRHVSFVHDRLRTCE